MNIYTDEGKWHTWDGVTNSVFDTQDQAEWFAATGETLSAAEAARSKRMNDKYFKTLANIKAGTRVMFDAQQNACFANIRLMAARGDITIAPDAAGEIKVTLNCTDEQLAQVGLDRVEEEAGLTALYKTLTSVSDADSHAITVFMD
jgi:hypothetical protein